MDLENVTTSAEPTSSGSTDSAANVAPIATQADVQSVPDSITTPDVGGELTAAGADTPVTAEVSAYKLNDAYSVRGEKKQFDPTLAALIKDPETEKKIRELYQKSDGIEIVRQEKEQAIQRLQEIEPAAAELQANVERTIGYLRQGDFASFQHELEIPDQMIIARAKEIIMHQKNPALRQAEVQRVQSQSQAREYQTQNQAATTEVQQLRVERRQFELQQGLARQDVAPLVQTFDEKRGEGAFRNECIMLGRYYLTHGVDKSVDEVIAEVQQRFSPFLNLGQGQGQPNTTVAPQGSVGTVPAQTRKPVVPAMNGSGSSPVKPAIKSLDDLKRLASSM
jgi:hypothetical protein